MLMSRCLALSGSLRVNSRHSQCPSARHLTVSCVQSIYPSSEQHILVCSQRPPKSPCRDLIFSRNISFWKHASVCQIALAHFAQPSRGKRRSTSTQQEEEVDEKEESVETIDDDDGEIRDYVTKKITVTNMRVDVVLKVALLTSRSKIEEQFLDGRIRINGEKPGKKAAMLAVDDEADLILGPDPKNNDFLQIARVVIDEVGTEAVKNRVICKVRVWKTMTIDNYKGVNKY